MLMVLLSRELQQVRKKCKEQEKSPRLSYINISHNSFRKWGKRQPSECNTSCKKERKTSRLSRKRVGKINYLLRGLRLLDLFFDLGSDSIILPFELYNNKKSTRKSEEEKTRNMEMV